MERIGWLKEVFGEMRGGRSDPNGEVRVKRARQFEGEERELTFSILSGPSSLES